MTVVVDVGCYTHPRYPEDESTQRLIDRFRPGDYYGFDPHPDLVPREDWLLGVVRANLCPCAAWTCDGEIAYDPRPDRPLAASIGSGPLTVACFDLAAWLQRLTLKHPRRAVIVKVDVEGAEYQLLEHVHEQEADRLVSLALVEWHQPPIGPADWKRRRDDLLARLRCPVEQW